MRLTAWSQSDIDLLVIGAICALAAVVCAAVSFVSMLAREWRHNRKL